MRVMVVTDQYEPMVGGVTAVTRGLARGLAERGHTVAVVAPSPRLRGSRRADGTSALPCAAQCAGPGTRECASAAFRPPRRPR